MKHVFLIITDTHFSNRSPKVRVDMRKEVKMIEDKILEVIEKYQNQSCKVFLIMLGDIFDGGIESPEMHTYFNNYFYGIQRKGVEIYAVYGNHDRNFRKNNPFYSLVRELNSNRIDVRNKVNCYGIDNVFKIIDVLEAGNVVFHFNHYASTPTRGEQGKINIGLFHEPVLCKSILNTMENQLGQKIFHDTFSEFDDLGGDFYGYKYSFFGHLHSVYGTWAIGNESNNHSYLCYLASLVRTKVNEIDDSFLERDIPAVVIENGLFKEIESNKFSLMTRKETVNEEKVEANRIKYEATKRVKEIKTFKSIERNPVDNLVQKCSVDVYTSQILSEIINNSAIRNIKSDLDIALAKEGIVVYE